MRSTASRLRAPGTMAGRARVPSLAPGITSCTKDVQRSDCYISSTKKEGPFRGLLRVSPMTDLFTTQRHVEQLVVAPHRQEEGALAGLGRFPELRHVLHSLAVHARD